MTEFARRTMLVGTAGLAASAMFKQVLAQGQAAKPKSPLSITIVDVAGNLALTQKAFEAYRKRQAGNGLPLRRSPRRPRRSCRAS